jgi:AraC-like DNA-binding protein
MTGPTLPIEPVAMFYREADLAYHVDAHRHTVHQIFICVHGGMTVAIDGVPFELKPDEAVIVPPDAERETWCHRRAPGYVSATFRDRELSLASAERRTLPLPADHRGDLHALILELRGPRDPIALHLANALLVRTLIGLKRAATMAAATGSALNQASVADVAARAEAYLQRNLHRQILRPEVAAAVRLSEPHLARLFKAATGRTVVGRLIEMRISRAKALLLESTMSVTQISGEVGLSSFSHFSKMFKRLVGVAPGDYRRSGGKAWR